MGHFDVDIRSLAKVEQPHLLQEPVPENPAGFHSGHSLHIAWRSFSCSGVVLLKPLIANLDAASYKEEDFCANDLLQLLHIGY
jgi:hypothetical protein